MPQLLHQRFRLLKKCGEGGAGDVYHAEDLLLKRKVAIKRVRAENEIERKARALRLVREAELLAKIEHPNVVVVHDCIETQAAATLVMELVDGVPFRQRFLKRAIPQHEFLPFLQQLLYALVAVHGARVIHRDLNPKNVLVRADDTLKITDFGLACAVDEPEPRVGGTIGYMAPESLRKGTRPSFGVDLYAVGLITYQALLGLPEFQRLYAAANPREWARWLLCRERFKPLNYLEKPVSQGFSTIVERLLEKDPRERYPAAIDVLKDLDRLAGRGPATEGPSLAAGMRKMLPGLLNRGSGQG